MSDSLIAAVRANDTAAVIEFINQDKTLAGRNFAQDSLHTDGFALYHAAANGNLEVVRLLLENGADPNAALDVEQPREFGMPICNAFEHRHYDVVNLLLNHGASVDAFPWCSACLTDQVYNEADWTTGAAAAIAVMVRHSYADYLSPEQASWPEEHLPVADEAPDSVKLLRRVLSLGGRPSLFTVVRHQQQDLLKDLLEQCPQKLGTNFDWPNGTVFANAYYGASWCGYPETIDLCRSLCPALYDADAAKKCVERAVRSHNRDGSFADYRRMIVSQLDFLKQEDSLTHSLSDGTTFSPLHILSDFIEPKNYGFKCDRLSTPADLFDLARLFIEFGYDINHVDPTTGQTPLDLAIVEKETEFQAFLIDNGAKEG